MVDVDHRRRNVGVAHVCLDVGEREDLDGEGAEAVAEVVEADVLEARRLQRGIEATAEGAVLDVLTGRGRLVRWLRRASARIASSSRWAPCFVR